MRLKYGYASRRVLCVPIRTFSFIMDYIRLGKIDRIVGAGYSQTAQKIGC